MKPLINLRSISLLASLGMTLLMYSCIEKVDRHSTDNEYIKSVSSNNTVVHKYLYDQTGRVSEENCFYYFRKYIYDDNERLVKVESAFDQNYSSTATEQRTEFMTSQNSAVDNYSLYHYDQAGRLSKIERYYKNTNDKFEYRSMSSFEYEGENIAKVNLHNSSGQVTQYNVYTYDKHGNVSIDKYYSNLFGSKDELVSETFYKYDNYKNPYQILNILGSPGLNMNTNNIIETNTIRYHNTPGIEKESSSKTTYEYNKKGYPIKEITETGEFEYRY